MNVFSIADGVLNWLEYVGHVSFGVLWLGVLMKEAEVPK